MFGKMMNRYYYGKSGKGDYTKEDLPQTRWQLFWEMLRVRLSGLIRLNLMYAVAWLPAIFVIGRGLLLWYAGLANVADAQMQLEAGEITAEALAEMTQSYTQGMSTIIMQTLLLLVPCLALTGPFTTAWPMSRATGRATSMRLSGRISSTRSKATGSMAC